MSKSELNRQSGPVLVGAFSAVFFNVMLLATVALSVLIQPMTKEFGWGRGQAAGMFTLGQWGVAISAPVVGSVLHRFGARRIQLWIILLSGPLIASLGLFGGSLVACYVIYGLIGLITPGAGPSGAVIASWFSRRRALALQVLGIASACSQAVTPWATNLLLGAVGWRGAYAAPGLAIFCVALPLQLLFFKENKTGPESGEDLSLKDKTKPDISFFDCLRSKTFWMLFCAHGAGMFAFVAFMPHAVAMGLDRGFSRSVAVSALSMVAVGSFCGHVVIGFSLDAFKAPRIMIPFISASLVGMLTMHHSTQAILIYPAPFLIGVGAGGEVSVLAYFITRYFGVRNFARVYGYMVPVLMVGAA